MGTRDDLLAAAKHCLARRGYARTTVRDIAAEAGANVAAINYHFRSREALLMQAMVESVGEAVHAMLPEPDGEPGDARARWDAFFAGLARSFAEDPDLWAANVEALAEAPRQPEVRAALARAQDRAGDELGAALAPGDADAVGALLVTLLTGLLAQWTINPERPPNGPDLAAGIAALGAFLRPS
ncbi:TetR/AcrR family transcriptional regulator [Streptomyces sp. NPDC000410]|uniref:TetR/AcrR family transcriptional regulator n=1 Tax=Streptomyces sp. NPDC000410 TaxID=3154254 RepID=UPI00332989BC